jgi:hypothetical protein
VHSHADAAAALSFAATVTADLVAEDVAHAIEYGRSRVAMHAATSSFDAADADAGVAATNFSDRNVTATAEAVSADSAAATDDVDINAVVIDSRRMNTSADAVAAERALEAAMADALLVDEFVANDGT